MINGEQRCETCGEPLGPSQYANTKEEGEKAVRAEDDLVCRNYPRCSVAEKPVTKND